jgi:multicomponent Na+:H+ antiporter subunit D
VTAVGSLPVVSHPWLPLLVFIPLFASLAAVMLQGHAARLLGALTALLLLAALVRVSLGVAATGQVHHLFGGWGAPVGIELMADGLSLAMLWLSWVVGVAVTAAAPGWFAAQPAAGRMFWPLWLMLWAALNATFLATDLFNLYVTMELLTLGAVALAALGGGAAALRAAMRYLLYALLGSMAWLLGVALIYGVHGVLDLHLLGANLVSTPATWLAAGLMSVGLMAKSALWPLHGWLPSAHARAPAPVSALLSALVVKASVYLLLRLWWWGLPTLTGDTVTLLLGLLGGIAMVYASLLALWQVRLKRVIAYSTIAQLGYLLLIFPLAGLLAWQGVLYHALSHGVAKAAMFLAAGNLMRVLGHDRLAGLSGAARQTLGPSVAALVLASVSLMGLPPSGGFIAKWLLLRAALEARAWGWAALIIVAGLLGAAYLFRVLACLLRNKPGHGSGCAPGEAPGQAGAPVEPAPLQLPRLLSVMPLLLALLAVLLGFVAAPLLRLFGQGAPFAAGVT